MKEKISLLPQEIHFIEQPSVLFFEVGLSANDSFPYKNKLKKLLNEIMKNMEMLTNKNLSTYFENIKRRSILRKDYGIIDVIITADIKGKLFEFRTILTVNDEGKTKIEHTYHFLCSQESL